MSLIEWISTLIYNLYQKCCWMSSSFLPSTYVKAWQDLIEWNIVSAFIISLKIVSAHAVKHIVIFELILRFSRSSLFETSEEANRDVWDSYWIPFSEKISKYICMENFYTLTLFFKHKQINCVQSIYLIHVYHRYHHVLTIQIFEKPDCTVFESL